MDDRVRKFLSSRDENILIVYGIRKSGKTSYMKNAIKGRKEKILYYQMKNTMIYLVLKDVMPFKQLMMRNFTLVEKS